MTSVEQELQGQSRWLHYVANHLLPWYHQDHDDVVQEGWIAMWGAQRTFVEGKGATRDGWLHLAARRRMADVAYRKKPPTGHEPLRGHWEPKDSSSLDRINESPGLAEEILPTAPDPLRGVELAYHHGAMMDALQRLTPTQKEYVVTRFWGGLYEKNNQRTAEQREVNRDLSPQFSNNQTRSSNWLAAREQLGFDLDHMRQAYGD